MPPLASATFSRAVDHTLLDPSAGAAAVDRLCDEAAFHEFVAVCVLPWSVGRCAARLAGCASRVATVVSFPHGMDATPAKCEAARGAAAAGADELDVVMAWGALDDDPAAVKEDLAAVVAAASSERPQTLVKAIVEASELTPALLARACDVAASSGAAFAKTSTGTRGGARVSDVRAMRAALPARVAIKASGGIRDAASAEALLAAGAVRLGTSSAIAILAELERDAVA